MKSNHIKKIFEGFKSFIKDPLFLKRWEVSYLARRQNENQLSVRISGHKKRKVYAYYGDSHMFVDDMYTGIMPFMHYSGEREKYPTRLEPASEEKERLISAGISERNYSRFLGDSLCEFVRTTAHVLLQDGVAFYEIVVKRNDSGEIEKFELELIQPFYLYKFFGNYYQFVPWSEAKQMHTRVRIIKIPAERIMRINLPKYLGGKKKIRKILKRLWQLSREFIPKFHMDAMGKNEDIGFDMIKFNREKYTEIAQLTADFGWNQRQRSDNYITEYYSLLRYLRSKKVEAVLREEIISHLNNTLNGSVLNLNVKIFMDNLFSSKDVDSQTQKFKEGDIAFMDIFNALKT